MLLWLSVMVTGLAGAATGDQVLMELQAAPCFPGTGDSALDDCAYLEDQQQLKRTAQPLPCSCESNSRLLDLGHQYWPRFLPSVECQNTQCYRGLYRCRPNYYEVKVLKKRDEMDVLMGHLDVSVPDSLRDVWKFALVKVVVGCECTL